ncbi:hypothetical protein [Jatrophihabitans sp.]|uniref:hypothetical protein n=1 Tax=Jatrophihabitans sp. TaxID=1932789 RepID=UPI0030C74CC1
MPVLVVAALAATAVLVCSCQASSRPAVVTTVQSTIVTTLTPSSTPFTPAPATTVAPLRPGASPRSGEIEKRCPYIASTPEQDPASNVADLNGSHVLRTTVVTTYAPVGCRFYFYAPPFQAIVDIVPRRFATAIKARNAMVRTAQAGTDAEGKPAIVPGVDAVLFRTAFFAPDGPRDWACVFAAGRTMVIVHTDRDETSLNALLIAKAVARKF